MRRGKAWNGFNGSGAEGWRLPPRQQGPKPYGRIAEPDAADDIGQVRNLTLGRCFLTGLGL